MNATHIWLLCVYLLIVNGTQISYLDVFRDSIQYRMKVFSVNRPFDKINVDRLYPHFIPFGDMARNDFRRHQFGFDR